MHFCFSSMSYNLIRNFWCVAGYLNIKIFRWSHWISHPCEIPWDVSCCLSVASPPPTTSLSLLTLAAFLHFHQCFQSFRARRLFCGTETKGSWRTSGNPDGCLSLELTQWDEKREVRFITWSESGWLLHRVSPPERGKTSGRGCCVMLTSCHHVEVSLQGLNLCSCVCLRCRCWCWFQCVCINTETDCRQST